MKQDLTQAGIHLPGQFKLEISYKDHKDAVRRSFFPGFSQVDDRTIRMETPDFWDVLRAAQFCL